MTRLEEHITQAWIAGLRSARIEPGALEVPRGRFVLGKMWKGLNYVCTPGWSTTPGGTGVLNNENLTVARRVLSPILCDQLSHVKEN